jgi:hypothetical protein
LWPIIGAGAAGQGLHGSAPYRQVAALPSEVKEFEPLESLVVVQATPDISGTASVSPQPSLVRRITDCPTEGPVETTATAMLHPVRKATSIWMPKVVIERLVPATGEPSHVIFCARISNSGRVTMAYPASSASPSELREMMAALRSLRFEPAWRRGSPVTAWHRIWVDTSILKMTPTDPTPNGLA